MAIVTPQGPTELAALGVRPPTREQVEAIGAYLKDTTALVDLTLVEFGGAKPGPRSMVLIPGEQVNVNYELLRPARPAAATPRSSPIARPSSATTRG